jgi:protein gp37
MVFCGSLCDVMDDEAPEEARKLLWTTINLTPNLTWQLLTKRPQRYSRYLPKMFIHRNVWLGTSAENQQFYNARWPSLSNFGKSHGYITFISYEPALGPLSMSALAPDYGYPDWVICGGESGHGHRLMERGWADNLKVECADAQVKFFMKQMSAQTPEQGAALIPSELLVRQFPEAR